MPIWSFDVPVSLPDAAPDAQPAPVTATLLSLDLTSLSVVTAPGAGGRVTVEVADDLTPLVEVGADGAHVSVRQVALVGRDRLTGLWPWGSRESRVRVTVPEGSRLEAHLDAGSLTGEQDWDHAEVRTAAGSVRLGACRTANVRAEAGSVTVASCGDGRLSAQAGSVRVGVTTGTVVASAEAGSVKVGQAREGSLDLRTGMGTVSVGVPVGTAVLADCHSETGRVSSELAARGEAVEGERRLYLLARTEMGTIRLRRA